MPYRRLPTTDKARIRAMDVALNKAAKNIIINLPFSEYMLDKLMSLKNTFVLTIKQYHLNIQNQNNKKKEYNQHFDTASMFLSHYIQTLYMCIERKEISEEALEYYGLEKFEYKLPALNSEEELLSWGEKILMGDKHRIQDGGSNIYNPSIAMVKIKLEEFRDISIFYKNLVKTTKRSANQLKELRISTNDFIAELWDLIEQNVGGATEDEKRLLAEEYGVVYVFRKKELKKKDESVIENTVINQLDENAEISSGLLDYKCVVEEPKEPINPVQQTKLNVFDFEIQEPSDNKKTVSEKKVKRKNRAQQTLELAFDFFRN